MLVAVYRDGFVYGYINIYIDINLYLYINVYVLQETL
jgi:hypothetical protein